MTASFRTPDDLQTLFDYNRWASTNLLDAMQDADAPTRAVELFSHLLLAQDVWYGRVEKTDHADLDFWATEPLSDCADRLDASTGRWQTVLDGRVADGGLDQGITYTNSKGVAYDTSLRDILVHVVNHGTHHRSQIALLLRQSDIAPPVTDYIFYLREE